MMATSLVSYIDRNAKTTPAICRYGCLKINIPEEIYHLTNDFPKKILSKNPLRSSVLQRSGWFRSKLASLAGESRFHLNSSDTKSIARNTKQPVDFFSSWITELLEEFFSKTRHPPRTRQPCLSDQTLKNEKCIQIPGNLAIFREHGLTSGYKTISIVERKEKTLRP